MGRSNEAGFRERRNWVRGSKAAWVQGSVGEVERGVMSILTLGSAEASLQLLPMRCDGHRSVGASPVSNMNVWIVALCEREESKRDTRRFGMQNRYGLLIMAQA